MNGHLLQWLKMYYDSFKVLLNHNVQCVQHLTAISCHFIIYISQCKLSSVKNYKHNMTDERRLSTFSTKTEVLAMKIFYYYSEWGLGAMQRPCYRALLKSLKEFSRHGRLQADSLPEMLSAFLENSHCKNNTLDC